MLSRLLLVLLVGLLAVPGAPLCHAAPSAPAMHHHQSKGHEPARAPTEQLCVGCVAPVTVPTSGFVPPLAYPSIVPATRAISGAAFVPAEPVTPPPRA